MRQNPLSVHICIAPEWVSECPFSVNPTREKLSNGKHNGKKASLCSARHFCPRANSHAQASVNMQHASYANERDENFQQHLKAAAYVRDPVANLRFASRKLLIWIDAAKRTWCMYVYSSWCDESEHILVLQNAKKVNNGEWARELRVSTWFALCSAHGLILATCCFLFDQVKALKMSLSQLLIWSQPTSSVSGCLAGWLAGWPDRRKLVGSAARTATPATQSAQFAIAAARPNALYTPCAL
jgi:hypothetical protein